MTNVAVIGCGNMAQAIVKGLYLKTKDFRFFTYTPSFTRADELAQAVNGVALKSLHDFKEIDFWMLGFKPQQLHDFSNSAKDLLRDKKLISLLAATSYEKLTESLGAKEVIRIMPNTPVAINQGISLLTHSPECKREDLSVVENMFKHLGIVYKTEDEKQFNELTPIFGSGPAYVYYLIQLYTNEAVKRGMSEESAKKLCVQLFQGASAYLGESTQTIQEMIDAVTSKGGVTIEAVNKLKEAKLDTRVNESLKAALERSNEIEKLLG